MEKSTVYTNPVIPGFFPDPSVIRVGDDYYLAASSFEYFPGVPIFHSKDLIHWEPIGHVLTRKSQVDLSKRKSSDGIYAPTLRYYNGTFYMITTDVRGIGNFYVTANHPAGPWSDPIRIPYGNIDPSLFFDDDGKAYVTAQSGWGQDSHIIQYEIDIATGQALSDPVVVCRGDGGVWTEGPHLYKIRGMYYLTCACGGTGVDHRVLVSRSPSPFGPFEMLPSPILTHNRMPDHPLQNLGHADLVEDTSGNWWAVFLGVRPIKGQYSVLGRETFLAPVEWTEDGWPMIDNNEGNVAIRMSVNRSMQLDEPEAAPVRKQFDRPNWNPVWSFLRERDEEAISLIKRPGMLRLTGNPYTLQDDAAPTIFVGKQQQHHTMEAMVQLEFQPQHEGEEAGLAARLNEKGHCRIGVKRSAGQTVVTAASVDKGDLTIHREVPVHAEALMLSIRSHDGEYVLAYSPDATVWMELARVPASTLSPEINGGFTGVLLGMYATGNGKPSETPADFHWFEYRS